MKLFVIIPAAGASRRYAEAHARHTGAADGSPSRSKLDEDMGGRPVLHRTLELFANLSAVAGLVVAGPADPAAMAEFKARHGDKLGILGAKICGGGRDHRYETVRNALALVPESATHIAVHDAARPCTSPELIERVLEAAEHHAAVIPAIDVADTIKRVDPQVIEGPRDPLAAILGADAGPTKNAARAVRETLDRTNLVAVQTPQVFRADVLRRAYQQKDLTSTDDAQLVERLGERVVVVPGERRNIKITLPEDLALARAMMGYKGPQVKEAHRRF